MRSFRRRTPRSRTISAASRRHCPSSMGRTGRRARSIELLEPRLFLANQPLITEFAASNGALLDGDGLSPDWIEIHNPTSQAINLAGWHLTDEADNLDKWTFPAAPQSNLDPGEYLIVFASNENIETYVDPAGYLHTDFSLSDNGEYLALTDPSQNIIHEYAPGYPRQVFDVSYGLLPNTSVVTLIGDSHPTSALVPTNSSLDATSVNVPPAWTLRTYNDGSWPSTTVGPAVGLDFGDDAPPGTANGTVQPGLIGFDLTDSDQNGVLDGTIFEGGPPNWPAAEQPPKALDNISSTKWLAFLAEGAPYGFRFANGQRHAVNAYTITSANDAPNRDPYAWTLSGSNDGVNYTLIDTRSAQTFTDRFQTRLYEFSNTAAYEYYRFDFKTKFGVTGLEVDRPSANAIQVAEIELFVRGPVDFNPHINLNVQSAYTPQKTSVYQRVEFEVADPASLLSLTLEMDYDDGIIVYLNGKRVAAANAPSATTLPTFQTNATSQRGNAAALIPQTFDLSPHLGELVAGTNVLAIHVLNVNDASQDLLSKPQLLARKLNDDSLIPVYMADPTPGALNVSGYVGLVEPPQFSVEHGFYSSPFQLAITTATPSAQIYYTTDGSAPLPTNGTLYTAPITIDRTRTIRADVFRDGWLSADSITNTYIFINEIVRQNYQAVINAGFPASWGGVAADYDLDPDVIGNFNTAGNPIGGDRYNGIYAATIKNDLLAVPTMSIVADMDDMFGPNGIYTNSTMEGVGSERAVSIELINPDGSTGFQVEAGIEIHGGAFKSHGLSRKHSFRLKFKGEYEGNTELEFPLFGNDAATSFDSIVLRMDSNDGYAWDAAGTAAQYARDEWGRRAQADLGQHSVHGTRVHLYINGVYWGIYNPVERADASFSASYYGGEKHEWDATNSGDPVDGNMTAWNTLVSLSQAVSSAATEAAKTAAYMKVLGLNPDGTDNASFETYLDAVNYADYLMVNFYGGNVDWPHRNWYASRLRGPDSQGFVFHNWDFETALDLAGSSVNTNNTGVTAGAAAPYSSLKSSQEFRVLFGDRVHRAFFNNGPLTSANSIARYQEVVAELQQIIVAESARWGDMHRTSSQLPYTKANWQAEILNVTNNFLTQRNNIFLNQLRTASLYPNVVAPTFSQHGGQVPSGYNLSITAPAGAIWYTVDGSDPRAIGGAVSPTARQYTGTPLNITGGITVRARALTAGQWSALNEADFATDVSNLRITELNYNPAAYPGVTDPQDIEFFEVLNTGSQLVSLNGVQIGGFADDPYTFANGLTLAGGQRIIVARDPAVFQFVYGPDFNVAPDGFDLRNLSNGGELVTLLGPLGEVLQSFTYGSTTPWPSEPDGFGPTLEIINPLGDSTSPANWRASFAPGGSPGTNGVVGDYDGNNIVEEADYQLWRSSYDLTVPRGTGADGNRNGIIDTADFIVWRKAFNAAPAIGASTIAAASVSSNGGFVSISPVGGVSDADINAETQRSVISAMESLATFPRPGKARFNSPARRDLPRDVGSDPLRDAALLAALELGVPTPVDSESIFALNSDVPRGDETIEWIDEAFESLTLL
jgi:CotH kinase protein/Lamin Tail Domain/Chitobiase/beta-hexosaminidase C-terminal domain